jgi:histidine triad (HIT) family protein
MQNKKVNSMTQQCPFCEIIEGKGDAVRLYEDEQVLVIADIMPLGLGHCLVIPRQHVQGLYDLPDETASHLLVVARNIARILRETLEFDGLQLIQNNGWAAGQRVFHFHLHLIPCQHGASPLRLNPAIRRRRVSFSQLRQTFAPIHDNIAKSLSVQEREEDDSDNSS